MAEKGKMIKDDKGDWVVSSPNAMKMAKQVAERLYKGNHMIVYNRVDGLFVFDRLGHLTLPKERKYYNTNQRVRTLYVQTMYTINNFWYTDWSLICYCLAFGAYDKTTGDYVIKGNGYMGDNKDNK